MILSGLSLIASLRQILPKSQSGGALSEVSTQQRLWFWFWFWFSVSSL